MRGTRDELSDALFGAFARVPRPGPIDACRCCLSEAEEAAALARVPLRELPRQAVRDLGGYLWHAHPVRGPDGLGGHVRYFAPRLLADACEPGWTWPPLELLTRRIRLAGWTSWPRAEQDGVRAFLRGLWREILAAGPGKPDVWSVLCAAGEIEDDVHPYLSEWESALGTLTAAEQVRWLLDHAVQYGDGTWQRVDTSVTFFGLDLRQVAGWLDRLWWTVAETYLNTEDPDLRTVLEEIESQLPVAGRGASTGE